MTSLEGYNENDTKDQNQVSKMTYNSRQVTGRVEQFSKLDDRRHYCNDGEKRTTVLGDGYERIFNALYSITMKSHLIKYML